MRCDAYHMPSHPLSTGLPIWEISVSPSCGHPHARLHSLFTLLRFQWFLKPIVRDEHSVRPGAFSTCSFRSFGVTHLPPPTATCFSHRAHRISTCAPRFALHMAPVPVQPMCVHHPRCTATNRPTTIEDRHGHNVAAPMVAPIVFSLSRECGKQPVQLPWPCGIARVVEHTTPPRGWSGHVVVARIIAQVLALIFPDKVWSGLIAATEDSNLRQVWLVRRRLVRSSFGQGRCSRISLGRSRVQATLRRYKIFKF